MTVESRRLAAVLLLVYPTVVIGGVSVLRFLVGREPGYVDNPLRQDLWRAGHAHAGVLLILSLVLLRYVDEAVLTPTWKAIARLTTPLAAILLPIAYFLSVLSPDATEANGIIALAFVGAAVLTVGFIVLGVGLLRRPL
jgi:hypothetical protein